jgi:hypothetical protein
MFFLLYYAALLLSFLFPVGSVGQTTITVDVTTLLTITSCNPTVRECSHDHSVSLSSSPIPFIIPSVPKSSSLLFSFSKSSINSSSHSSSKTTSPSSKSPSSSSSYLSCSSHSDSSSSHSLSASPSLLRYALCRRTGQNICNEDNCLRAFMRGKGQEFCSSLTKSVVTVTIGLPSYATQCKGSTISRVSSACSCLNAPCVSVTPSHNADLVPDCNADNCLRAFDQRNGQAFCSTFTKSVVTETGGLPSYTTQCTGSTIARVSSACSCLNRGSAAASQPGMKSMIHEWQSCKFRMN